MKAIFGPQPEHRPTLDEKKSIHNFAKKVGKVLLHFVPGFIKRLFGKLPCFCSYDNPLKLRLIAEWRFKTLITTTLLDGENKSPKVYSDKANK